MFLMQSIYIFNMLKIEVDLKSGQNDKIIYRTERGVTRSPFELQLFLAIIIITA